MITLATIVIVLLAISFLCSVLESVILSLTFPYIRTLVDAGRPSGAILERYKVEIEEPITAILTLNTISHTIGATISGALALEIFGQGWMALFSVVLTLLILVFSEIIPKTVGAWYWKELGPAAAYLLRGIIFLLKPVIVPVHAVSRLFSPGKGGSAVTRAEMLNYLRLGRDQGLVTTEQLSIIENVMKIESVNVRRIMTPRRVVFWLPHGASGSDVMEGYPELGFSRIPLYDPKRNVVTGIVLRRDIMDRLRHGKTGFTLRSLAAEPVYIPDTMSVYRLLEMLVDGRRHMAVVLNEYGDYTGIVTLEDVMEALLGREIVDEFDTVEDLAAHARDQARGDRPGNR